MKACAQPGCPEIQTQSHCPTHTRQREHARGTRQQRGYDTQHDRERTRWAPLVRTGMVNCARCNQPITTSAAWDLGHTDDRTRWTGPEHAHCNRAAGGRAAHAGIPRRRT
jgi:hypothetical protein